MKEKGEKGKEKKVSLKSRHSESSFTYQLSRFYLQTLKQFINL